MPNLRFTIAVCRTRVSLLAKCTFEPKSFVCPCNISGEYLLEICALVDRLHIDPWYSGDNYLFGLRNENWGILLAEMFAKRVSFIEIDNGDHPVLQTPQQMQHVIEVGLLLERSYNCVQIQSICTVHHRNVLKTHCGDRLSQLTVVNEHVIKGKSNGKNQTMPSYFQ